ncbi:MAG TPA: lipid-A-disaccharide synthase [Candidatus Binataceae bacterium]|nr:lipid-A-disaccharide synthase [Candidatus Binataceae bacterium]
MTGTRPRRILMIAGEASGDHLGADLAAQILALAPACEIFGMAGERMRASGVSAVVNTEEVSGMGATELASTIGPILAAFRQLVKLLRRDPPDLVILIDFPDFNLKFAWFARRAGVPVLYYVPPQVWAWRRWRIRTLVKRADQLAVVFPFEAPLYERAGGRVTFVGHALLDRVQPAQDRTATLDRHGFKTRARLLALLPGSRRGEIRYLLRPMLEAARVLRTDHDLEPVIALANTLSVEDLRSIAGPEALAGVRIIEGDTYSIIAASELALVASGTATLEAALLGCPMVIAYKMSALSYAVGRALVRGVDCVGMPNLLAGRQVVPELIQYDVTPAKLVRAAEPMLDESLRREVIAELRALRMTLGEPGASARVAAIALQMSDSCRK